MAKKDSRLGTDPLSGSARGVDSLIRDTKGDSKQSLQGKQSKQKKGRPKTSTRIVERSTQEGTKEGWERATFIIREDFKEKLKATAYWDRKEIKEVMDEALTAYFKSKRVKPLPQGGK